jgi:uroporphyrinogen-III synthase
VTSASAKEAGLNVDIMQGPYVISGLVRAMIKALNNNE